MTRGILPGFAGRLRTGGALLLVALVAAGCFRTDVRYRRSEGGSAPLAFADDRTKVEVISAKVGGKNVFIPSTLVLTAGEGRVLSFFNTTDTPHGMSIPGLGVAAILPAGEEFEVTLPPLEAGHVYDLQCHLHPPHRSASLVVVPAE